MLDIVDRRDPTLGLEIDFDAPSPNAESSRRPAPEGKPMNAVERKQSTAPEHASEPGFDRAAADALIDDRQQEPDHREPVAIASSEAPRTTGSVMTGSSMQGSGVQASAAREHAAAREDRGNAEPAAQERVPAISPERVRPVETVRKPQADTAPSAQSAPQVDLANATVAVVGLGYVGLPVAAEFGKRRPTIGYDISRRRVESLQHQVDTTGEVATDDLAQARHLRVTQDATALSQADFIIVAVPTPINAARQPDLGPLESASAAVGAHLKPGAIVIYESTVYPGTTEEVCVPILEKESGMRWRQDFHVAYSPERINPGDRDHNFAKIIKIVSADDAETLDKVAELYGSVVSAGVCRVSSIRAAEAAKVIENTQRDLNIAFVNELSIIFDKLGLDTLEVLTAAGTKWNFLPFRPGLVGGHCIGVDPYYLTHKAELLGYHPQVILAGRRINDGMGSYIARKTVLEMIHAGRNIKGAKVNILGMTFKENCPDVRNSKVVDIVRELREYGVETFVHDPAADPAEALEEYDVRLRAWDDLPVADALILAVAHNEFVNLPVSAYLRKIVRRGCMIDVKSVFDPAVFRREGLRVWRL
jgi:UDP-N-acetyl-D-glucosamine/UDP-N-acetyl-D-galactosamine dehydrogenase